MFGTPAPSSSFPTFGTPSSTPAFGTPSTTPAFGTPSTTPAFGTPSTTPAFGTPSSTPAFGTPSTTPAFATPSSTPAFGTPSTPSLSPFLSQPQQQASPFSIVPQQQQQQQQPFGLQASPSPFGNAQITTQMAPVAPLQLPLADRDLHAIIDAYKEEAGNPKYAFRHLLLSVTDPTARVKPVGASDIMWAEAMAKLEGMDSTDRDRLWPQLIQGFKDLSERLKLQDEVLVSDAERLKMTQANVKMLQRHFQADTLQWIQRLKRKEQVLIRRIMRVMRIVETLEAKGLRMPLTRGEMELAEKLASITRQLRGPGAELSRRIHSLLSTTRVHANTDALGGWIFLPGSARIQEENLAEMQEVLQQETEAIARLGNVLKRDMRDMEIIMSEDTDDMLEDGGVSRRSVRN